MTTQVEPIRGKVASVLNSREVALNRGLTHGVKTGMKFNILRHDAHEITDPDSGDKLGTYQPTKVCVKVSSVYDSWSLAETFARRRVNRGGDGLGLGMFTPPRWVDEVETLKLNDASVQEISESGSYVSKGDPIVQVFEDTKVE